MLLRCFVLLVVTVSIGALLGGCGKKEATLEQMQEPMSMEALSTLKMQEPTAAGTTAGAKGTEISASAVKQPVAAGAAQGLEPLPPSGPYKPSVADIQTALKNAGFYTGSVDGKIGPKTKAAIEEFQRANGLGVDGKVGPKTWSLLSRHVAAAPQQQGD